MAEYRAENPDKARESSKRSREKNGHKYAYQKSLRLLFDDEHRESTAEKNKAWRVENEDVLKIKRLAYIAENPDLIREQRRRYQENNKESRRILYANNKAKRRGAEGKFTKDDIARIFSEQDGACYWCGCSLADGYHVDHFIPVAKGGTNWPDNLVLACPVCNTSRGAKSAEEFREYLAFIAENLPEIEKRRAYVREKMREFRARES